MLTGIIAVSIVYCVMVSLILGIFPRMTVEDRAAEDADFVRQYTKRKGE